MTMKRLLAALACAAACAAPSFAQKGKAAGDFYPMGYDGDVWAGEVTAFDNAARTLTLTHRNGKKEQTFVATLPDAPYEWTRDIHNARVLDFPYDKKSKTQVFKYDGPGRAATVMPDSGGVPGAQGLSQILRRPNPPDENRITDLSDFKGRRILVYYTVREREAGGVREKYNDVWRVKVLSGKKN
jgi:hypothetical protein